MKSVEFKGFQIQSRRELSAGPVQRALTHRSTRTLPPRVTFNTATRRIGSAG